MPSGGGIGAVPEGGSDPEAALRRELLQRISANLRESATLAQGVPGLKERVQSLAELSTAALQAAK